MDSIRVTAKTVEDAITEASIQLGTNSDNIEYTVIDEGSKGFFGIGGRKAVIEAKKKFTDEDLMKEVFGDAKENPKKEFRKEPAKEFKKEFKKERKEDKREEKREGKESRKETKEGKEFKKEDRKPEKKQEKKPEIQETKSEVKKEAPKQTAEKPKEAKAAQENREKKEEPIVKTPRVPADPEEAKRRAETFLNGVFSTMEMKVEVNASFEEDTLSIDLMGDDMGLLIGKRGQTLDSLQYLTSLVVNKGKASYVRVKLDTEDYRNRRKATLENLAKNIAFKVKKTRRPVFLEPMNPYERRIIHSALQNDPYVTTHSEGDEPCRKVVVTLKKNK
jgi:spoIIIJ-associated protein